MTVPVHKLHWLALAVLSAVSLSACGVQDSTTADGPPLAAYADAETGETPAPSTDAPAAGGPGGRATYEGTAGGLYALGAPALAFRYFGAQVRLTADLGDNYIWGAITDGRDSVTLERIFERLTLAPAALDADETAFFEDRLTGVVGGKPFAGEWSGRFSGSGSVAGTFRAGTGNLGEGLFGSFDATYRAHVNRTMGALNGLSERIGGRLAHSVARTAGVNPVSSADAPETATSTAGDVSWNTGVTQSSRNYSSPGSVNQAIGVRYEGDALVFERVNLLSHPPERFTTGNEPEAPGYRQAASPILGSARWKGVEYLSIDSSQRPGYSILFSDISGSDDLDYLAGGFAIGFPGDDDPADTAFPSFTVAASGSDPFRAANIEPLVGVATYDGDAAGFYASKITTPALRYFNADARLIADFHDNIIRGFVTEGRDTATNELIFRALTLTPAHLLVPTHLAAERQGSFMGSATGIVNGRLFAGSWGGQFFGNGESAADVPGSVGGTFGAAARDGTESVAGFFGAYDRDLTRLPPDHDLARGRIVVQPGDSVDRGETSISCPEGGLPCIVTVEADGAAFYDRDGGVPAFYDRDGGVPGFKAVYGGHSQDNPGAEDLLDHWNRPALLRGALGLSVVRAADLAGRRNSIVDRVNAAGGDSTGTGTKLRNARPENIEIIGERNGIAHGRWTGGPAGTLNIEFDWRFAPDVSPEVRAMAERAGKSWSRRLRDEFGLHVVQRGTTIRTGAPHAGALPLELVFEEAVETDGVLVAVAHTRLDPLSSAGPWKADITYNDYEPWLGILTLSQRNIDERDSIGSYWLSHVLAHEIGHIIGVTSHEGGWHVPSYERYLNRGDHTFGGPASRRANGGEPVPFQWLDPDRHPVPPYTPGASVDYAHLGVCASIMAYCTDARATYEPSELDFAFLADIGYEVLDAETAAEPELYGYGAWGSYSAWGVGVERVLGYEERDGDVFAHDAFRAGADAFGAAPGVALGEQTLLQGNVTWSGSLIGVDLGQAMLPPVFGDAELSVELSSMKGTAAFDELEVYVDGVSADFRKASLEYAIDVTGNAFSDENGNVRGGFFGPEHQEMAGVLDDRTPEVRLLAGFGGKR